MRVLKNTLMTGAAFIVVLLDMFMASPVGAFISAVVITLWIFALAG